MLTNFVYARTNACGCVGICRERVDVGNVVVEGGLVYLCV